MLVRLVTVTALLVVPVVPAFSQTPDPTPPTRPRAFMHFNYRIPEFKFRMNRVPRIDVGEVRRRALEHSLEIRRQLANRGFAMRFRADTRRGMMEDRNWQRRREVEQRAVERMRDQVNRMKLRQPLVRRRPFRDI